MPKLNYYWIIACFFKGCLCHYVLFLLYIVIVLLLA